MVGRLTIGTHLGLDLAGGLDTDSTADATTFDHDVVFRRISDWLLWWKEGLNEVP